MSFPDDTDFVERKIERVEENADGTYNITCDGWGIWCGREYKGKPAVGMTARYYPNDSTAVRGLFIDGEKAWYRTKDEDEEFRDIQLYGLDAADWLSRWDAGRGVWSIEMGGLGPGYEQCIQITTAEILRHLLEAQYDHSAWDDKERWKADRDKIEQYSFQSEEIKRLGLSGAQWGAALNLAAMLYARGPRQIMGDSRVKDRHIQVSKTFP